jgi:hypothetical protein
MVLANKLNGMCGFRNNPLIVPFFEGFLVSEAVVIDQLTH